MFEGEEERKAFGEIGCCRQTSPILNKHFFLRARLSEGAHLHYENNLSLNFSAVKSSSSGVGAIKAPLSSIQQQNEEDL